MNRRLPNMSFYRCLDFEVEAEYYNLITLALTRLSEHLLLKVPGLDGFELNLNRDHWICHDANLDYHPILAWSNFHPQQRHGLLEPMPCQLYLYHPFAEIVMHSLLKRSTPPLTTLLRMGDKDQGARIIPLYG